MVVLDSSPSYWPCSCRPHVFNRKAVEIASGKPSFGPASGSHSPRLQLWLICLVRACVEFLPAAPSRRRCRQPLRLHRRLLGLRGSGLACTECSLGDPVRPSCAPSSSCSARHCWTSSTGSLTCLEHSSFIPASLPRAAGQRGPSRKKPTLPAVPAIRSVGGPLSRWAFHRRRGRQAIRDPASLGAGGHRGYRHRLRRRLHSSHLCRHDGPVHRLHVEHLRDPRIAGALFRACPDDGEVSPPQGRIVTRARVRRWEDAAGVYKIPTPVAPASSSRCSAAPSASLRPAKILLVPVRLPNQGSAEHPPL